MEEQKLQILELFGGIGSPRVVIWENVKNVLSKHKKQQIRS